MKAYSGHILFDNKLQWKDLGKIYPDLFRLFINEAKILEMEINLPEVVLFENMLDIKKNRKPEGYNREGKLRFYFIENERKELIVVRDKAVPCEETRYVTEKLSKFLSSKRIKHNVEWDKMFLIELRRRKR